MKHPAHSLESLDQRITAIETKDFIKRRTLLKSIGGLIAAGLTGTVLIKEIEALTLTSTSITGLASTNLTASGSYAGNSSADRGIVHGMGVKPKIVILYYDVKAYFIIKDTEIQGAHAGPYTVTAKDATNFYVGDAASYTNSANQTGETYNWVAIA